MTEYDAVEAAYNNGFTAGYEKGSRNYATGALEEISGMKDSVEFFKRQENRTLFALQNAGKRNAVPEELVSLNKKLNHYRNAWKALKMVSENADVMRKVMEESNAGNISSRS